MIVMHELFIIAIACWSYSCLYFHIYCHSSYTILYWWYYYMWFCTVKYYFVVQNLSFTINFRLFGTYTTCVVCTAAVWVVRMNILRSCFDLQHSCCQDSRVILLCISGYKGYTACNSYVCKQVIMRYIFIHIWYSLKYKSKLNQLKIILFCV